MVSVKRPVIELAITTRTRKTIRISTDDIEIIIAEKLGLKGVGTTFDWQERQGMITGLMIQTDDCSETKTETIEIGKAIIK